MAATPLTDLKGVGPALAKKLEKLGVAKFEGDILVIADQSTPYRLLSEVLYTAGQAEFAKYRLMKQAHCRKRSCYGHLFSPCTLPSNVAWSKDCSGKQGDGPNMIISS